MLNKIIYRQHGIVEVKYFSGITLQLHTRTGGLDFDRAVAPSLSTPGRCIIPRQHVQWCEVSSGMTGHEWRDDGEEEGGARRINGDGEAKT